MKFKLDRLPGIIKRMQVLTASTVPDKEGRPVQMVEVEFLLEVNATNGLKELHSLFPNADVIASMVAGDDDMPGQDVTARGKLGEMALLIHYGAEKDPVVEIAHTLVKSRPQLKIDENGNAKLIIKPRGKLNAKGMTEAWKMLLADGFISVLEAQVDLDDFIKGEEEKEKTAKAKKESAPKGKGKAAKEKKATTADELFGEDPVPMH